METTEKRYSIDRKKLLEENKKCTWQQHFYDEKHIKMHFQNVEKVEKLSTRKKFVYYAQDSNNREVYVTWSLTTGLSEVVEAKSVEPKSVREALQNIQKNKKDCKKSITKEILGKVDDFFGVGLGATFAIIGMILGTIQIMIVALTCSPS